MLCKICKAYAMYFTAIFVGDLGVYKFRIA